MSLSTRWGSTLPAVWVVVGAGCSVWPWSADTGEAEAKGDCGREPPLSYDNFGQGWMDTHCAGCHSSYLPEGSRQDAPLGVDFDTYAGVLAWVARIEARATGANPTMPPGGGPSDEEIELLAEWLQCSVFADAEEVGAR